MARGALARGGPLRGAPQQSAARAGRGLRAQKGQKKTVSGKIGSEGLEWGYKGGCHRQGCPFPSRKCLAQVPQQAKKKKREKSALFQMALSPPRHPLQSSLWLDGWFSGF